MKEQAAASRHPVLGQDKTPASPKRKDDSLQHEDGGPLAGGAVFSPIPEKDEAVFLRDKDDNHLVGRGSVVVGNRMRCHTDGFIVLPQRKRLGIDDGEGRIPASPASVVPRPSEPPSQPPSFLLMPSILGSDEADKSVVQPTQQRASSASSFPPPYAAISSLYPHLWQFSPLSRDGRVAARTAAPAAGANNAAARMPLVPCHSGTTAAAAEASQRQSHAVGGGEAPSVSEDRPSGSEVQCGSSSARASTPSGRDTSGVPSTGGIFPYDLSQSGSLFPRDTAASFLGMMSRGQEQGGGLLENCVEGDGFLPCKDLLANQQGIFSTESLGLPACLALRTHRQAKQVETGRRDKVALGSALCCSEDSNTPCKLWEDGHADQAGDSSEWCLLPPPRHQSPDKREDQESQEPAEGQVAGVIPEMCCAKCGQDVWKDEHGGRCGPHSCCRSSDPRPRSLSSLDDCRPPIRRDENFMASPLLTFTFESLRRLSKV
ncbi:hypothetical protein CSUI_007228, partial [Cystoisospora suis]